VARTVCRRAERRAWSLIEVDAGRTNPLAAKYLNRLSDLIFILGRRANPDGDVKWVPGASRSQ
jgi:cob(I)alamin adenosyltransferase